MNKALNMFSAKTDLIPKLKNVEQKRLDEIFIKEQLISCEENHNLCMSKDIENIFFINNRFPHKSFDLKQNPSLYDEAYKHINETEPYSLFKVDKYKISDIISFRIIGNIQYTTQISGGGGSGGGVNMAGAVTGGMLLGGAGAIINFPLRYQDVQITMDPTTFRKSSFR